MSPDEAHTETAEDGSCRPNGQRVQRVAGHDCLSLLLLCCPEQLPVFLSPEWLCNKVLIATCQQSQSFIPGK